VNPPDRSTRALAVALDFAAAHTRGDTRLCQEIALAADPFDLATGLAGLCRGMLTQSGHDPLHVFGALREAVAS
jgi:hypothetical protein